jgi:hypothetical protein
MAAEARRLELNLPQAYWMKEEHPTTPSEWFAQRFPDAASQFGCPFLEVRQTSYDGLNKITPIAINLDFFAGMLGGDSKLSHSVIYYEAELQFYYFEPLQQIYKPTTPEKLQNYYRALLLRCAQELNRDTDKLNLFAEFRSDKNARAITTRAKSILAASPDFFSATSPHTRIRGVELHERLARRFVDELLSVESGKVLMLADAYAAFCSLLKQRELEPVKRSDFKAMLGPLIRDQFNVALRNDLVVDERQGVRGWKNLRLTQTVPS